MARKDEEGSLSASGDGFVRKPASSADILGRKPGSKVKPPPSMSASQTKQEPGQVPTRQRRNQKLSAVAVFGPDGARQRNYTAELRAD